MDSTLYVETNYPIGYAKGQDPEADAFLRPGAHAFRLAIPCVCFMEALTVLNAETKARNRFLDELSAQIRETGRDRTSEHARRLVQHLAQGHAEAKGWLEDFRNRLTECLYLLSQTSEIIPLDPTIALNILGQPLLDDPTDRLILHSILWHARLGGPGPKAFLSGNSNDFGQPAALEALTAAGVRYFARSEAAIGWLKSQTSS